MGVYLDIRGSIDNNGNVITFKQTLSSLNYSVRNFSGCAIKWYYHDFNDKFHTKLLSPVNDNGDIPSINMINWALKILHDIHIHIEIDLPQTDNFFDTKDMLNNIPHAWKIFLGNFEYISKKIRIS